MSYHIQKIISGGQTGAGIGALVAAKKANIATGGTALRDFMTEKGPQPVLADYGLVASNSPMDEFKTEVNVKDSDATLIMSRDPRSQGTAKTIQCALKYGKSFSEDIDPSQADAAEKVCDFLLKHKPGVLNVAGNRESTAPGISREVASTLGLAFQMLSKTNTSQAGSKQELEHENESTDNTQSYATESIKPPVSRYKHRRDANTNLWQVVDAFNKNTKVVFTSTATGFRGRIEAIEHADKLNLSSGNLDAIESEQLDIIELE